METNWPWTACPWDSMRDRSPPSSDTMELAKPQLCKIVHMLSTVLPSFAELRVWHLIKDLKVCPVEVLTVFLCFLLVSDQGQSWQGCFHPPLAQPTFSAKTFVLNSAQSGRIWVYALSTTYFSACTYAVLGADFCGNFQSLVLWLLSELLLVVMQVDSRGTHLVLRPPEGSFRGEGEGGNGTDCEWCWTASQTNVSHKHPVRSV